MPAEDASNKDGTKADTKLKLLKGSQKLSSNSKKGKITETKLNTACRKQLLNKIETKTEIEKCLAPKRPPDDSVTINQYRIGEKMHQRMQQNQNKLNTPAEGYLESAKIGERTDNKRCQQKDASIKDETRLRQNIRIF